MPEFSKPVIGNFCWIEANVEDPQRAKGFYGELFGWAFQEMPTPMGPYAMATIGGKHIGGIFKLADEAKKMGAPPHWMNFVAVEDTPAATEKAKSLGATVLLPPTAVGPGTMSIVRDPTGGAIALWATQQSMGTFLWGETGSLCWTELATTDVAAAKAFYEGLFGWKTETFPMGGSEYTIVKNGDQMIGGIMAQPEMMKGLPSFWGAYFAVDDCDAVATKAGRLGGSIVVPPTDIPTVGRFAVIKDADGAVFSIIKNVPRAS